MSTTSCAASGAPGWALSHSSRNLARKREETSTGESTRPVSCESHGRILAVRSTSGFDSHDFAECTRRVGTMAPWSRAYAPTGWPSSRNRNEGSVRRGSDAPGGHQLRGLENPHRREIPFLGFGRVDVGQRGVGGAEVDADVHAGLLDFDFRRRDDGGVLRGR